MNARAEVFRTASAYHKALAGFVRASRRREDLETPAQAVVAASLYYRMALDRFILDDPADLVGARRAQALRRLLHQASAAFQLYQRHQAREGHAALWR